MSETSQQEVVTNQMGHPVHCFKSKLSGNWNGLNTVPESDGELLVREGDRHEGADRERQHDHQGDRDVPRLEHQLRKS